MGISVGAPLRQLPISPGSCSQKKGSCLKQQLNYYYEYDEEKAAAGAIGKYWLQNLGSYGLSDLVLADAQGVSKMQSLR